MNFRQLFFRLMSVPAQVMISLGKLQDRVPILLFHRVSEVFDPFTEPLPPRDFERIIEYFGSRYRFRSVDDLVDLDKEELKGSCIVAFDDAMKDFREYAWPILKRLGVPTCMFVPVQAVEEKGTIWNYTLFSHLQSLKQGTHDVEVGGKRFEFNKDHLDYQSVMNLHAEMLMLSRAERLKVLEEISSLAHKPKPFAEVMSWDELMQLHKEGLSLGTHTWGHDYYPSLTVEEMERDIYLANSTFQRQMGFVPRIFAYPVGGYNDLAKNIIGAHYDYAFVVGDKRADLHDVHNEPHTIARVNVSDRSPIELAMRVHGFHKFLKRLKS